MYFGKLFLVFALVMVYHTHAKGVNKANSKLGKLHGTSPISAIWEHKMDLYEEGCNCNDTGCDCLEQLNACCRMGFCCGEDYPICCPLVCCPPDFPVCTNGNTCNPY
jgi:hypothetical protein